MLRGFLQAISMDRRKHIATVLSHALLSQFIRRTMTASQRLPRLIELIGEVRRLLADSSEPSVLLRVLNGLRDEEIQELGTRHLNMERHGDILDRMSQALDMDRRIVWGALVHSLAWDLEDFSDIYDAATREYETSAWSDAEIKNKLEHNPPERVSFLHRFSIGDWNSKYEARGSVGGLGLRRVEDDSVARVFRGYLIKHGFVYPTTVALLRASMEQQWQYWQKLWGYF